MKREVGHTIRIADTTRHWVTSDHHFGHGEHGSPGILGFRDHNYQSIKEHDDDLIRRWNSVVKPGDTVWYVGDMFFYYPLQVALSIRRRLNGDIHFLKGNHDGIAHKCWKKYGEEMFSSFRRGWVLQPLVTNRRTVYLNHYRDLSEEMHGNGHEHLFPETDWLLHGHTHSKSELSCVLGPNKRKFHVGIDAHDLTPIRLDYVLDRIDQYEVLIADWSKMEKKK
jgi:calcineurin-like phosphoesterase family protein